MMFDVITNWNTKHFNQKKRCDEISNHNRLKNIPIF